MSILSSAVTRKSLYRVRNILVVGVLAFVLIPIPPAHAVSISYVGKNNTSTTGGSMTLNKVTGVVTNDVEILVASTNNAATTSFSVSGGGSGEYAWNVLGTFSSGGITFTSYSHLVQASEPASYTITITGAGGRSAAGVSAYHLNSPTKPVDVHAEAYATACNITAPSATLTGNNDWLLQAYAAAGSNILAAPTITPGGGATSRYTQTSGGGLLTSGFISIEQGDDNAAFGAPGATGTRTGTLSTTGSTDCVGQLIAIRPNNFDWNQSASRWFSNNDSQDLLSVESHPSGTTDDKLQATAIDTPNNRIYTAGYESSNGNDWRIESRKLTTGELCSVGPCGVEFGSGGVVSENVSANDDEITAIAIDSTNNWMYLVGYDKSAGSTDAEWRLERRSLIDGSLDSAFGTGGIITENPTSGNDIPKAIALDVANGAFYLGGYDSTSGNEWRMEKRSTVDGSLDGTFGTSGVQTADFTAGSDQINALSLDSANSQIYFAGTDSTPGSGNTRWRVEKRSTSTAALTGAFGTSGVFTDNPVTGVNAVTSLALDTTNSALYVAGYDAGNSNEWRVDKIATSNASAITGFGTSGILTVNPSSGDDKLQATAVDVSGGWLYMGGYDSSAGSGEWRTQKVLISTGANVSAFGTSGVVTSNPSSSMDQINNLIVDTTNSIIYTAGYSGANSNQWRIERRSSTDGSKDWQLTALASQDTAYSADPDQAMRLRILLHNTTDNLQTTDTAQQFKLMYSPKNGTCDTAGVGESYVPVATSGTPAGSGTDILYKDNPNPSTTDGTAMVTQTGDPAHGGDTTVPLSYEESPSFSTNGTAVNFGQDIEFDVSLTDNISTGGYCFEAWNNSGSDIYTHTTVAEIVFCHRGRTDQDLRHGTYFCEGVKNPFYWN